MSTPEKAALLHKLNTQADAEHQKATERADRLGKAHPAPPPPMEPTAIEFPKYLHKGWKAGSKAPGHFVAEESELAHNAEQAKALEARGFSEAPPKSEAKEAPKKKE